MSPDTKLRETYGVGTRTIVDSIVKTYGRADEATRDGGQAWYGDIVDVLAAESGRSRETVAAVISHLSPRTRWAANVRAARQLLTVGTVPVGTIGDNADRARVALNSATPLDTFGPDAHKTARFARNLLGETDVVTVDVWAQRVAVGDRASDKLLKRVGVYAALEHCYRLAARRVGVSPAAMQATTWIVVRGSAA